MLEAGGKLCGSFLARQRAFLDQRRARLDQLCNEVSPVEVSERSMWGLGGMRTLQHCSCQQRAGVHDTHLGLAVLLLLACLLARLAGL